MKVMGGPSAKKAADNARLESQESSNSVTPAKKEVAASVSRPVPPTATAPARARAALKSMPFAAAMGAPVSSDTDESAICSTDPVIRAAAEQERERCKRILGHAMKAGQTRLGAALMKSDVDEQEAIAVIDSFANTSAVPASADASPVRSTLADRMAQLNQPGVSQ
jgi:hypothetical protein